MSKRALFVNLTAGYLGNFTLLGLGILTKVLLARILVPAQLGIVISAQIIFGLGSFVATLGLADAVVHYVATDKGSGGRAAGHLVSAALRLAIPAAIIVSLVIGFGAPLIGNHAAPGVATFPVVLMVFAVGIPVKVFSDLVGATFQGLGTYWVKVVAVDIVPAAVAVCAFAVLGLLGRSGAIPVAGVYLGSGLLAAVLLARMARSAIPVANASQPVARRTLVQYGLPLLASGVVAWPVTLVPVIIGSLISPESVAYYSLAVSLASFVYLGTNVAEAASFGVWSTYLGEKRRESLVANYRLLTRWGFVMASVVFVPLFFCAEEVVRTVFGPNYGGSARILPLLALTFLINVATGPNESILKALGATSWILLMRLVTSLTVAVSLYPLARRFGLEGAVISYMISAFVPIIMYSGFLYHVHHIHPFDGQFLRVAISIVCSLGVVAFSSPWLAVRTSALATIALHVSVFLAALAASIVMSGALGETERSLLARLRMRFTPVKSSSA